MTAIPIVLDIVGVPAPQGDKSAIITGGRARLIESNNETGRMKMRAWRDQVRRAAADYVKANGLSPIDEPVRVEIMFRFAATKSDPYRHHHTVKPDISKITRSTEDALVLGGLLVDDARISDETTRKRWCEPDEAPGATVTIWRSGFREQQARDRRKRQAKEARTRQVPA